MPRTRRKARREVVQEIGEVSLQALPPEEPSRVSAGELRSQLFTIPPRSAKNRRRFGRGISLDVIEQALRNAHRGNMRDLTDLSRETIDTDPHLAAVLAKRFGALTALPWEVIPATGPGVDPERAKLYAEIVRNQLVQMPRFSQAIYQLAWGIFDNRAALEIDWAMIPGNSVGNASTPWVVKGLGWIHPRRLRYGPERELRILGGPGAEQHSEFSVSGFDPIGTALRDVPFKFIEFTPQIFADYAEREGLASRCLYWSFFKRFGARERMILVELFGKPWRVIEVDEESTADEDDLKVADQIVDSLGATNSARMPRGTKLNVVQPGNTAGAVHKDVIKESDEQISKLVLGQTGTTDGVPAGFNSNQAAIMKDEQLMILMRDSRAISEAIEDHLTDAIIRVNFGDQAVTHAPKFKLSSDLPADKNTELDRIQKALDAGLSISASEAYEVAGLRIPNPTEEATIRIDQPPTPPLAPVAPPPRAIIVHPKGAAPEPGEQQGLAESPIQTEAEAPKLPVSDLKSVMKVNEAREREGLGPLTLADGSLDPDGELTVSVYDAKNAAKADPVSSPSPASDGASASPGDSDDDGEDPDDNGPDGGGSGGPSSPSGGGSPLPEGGGETPPMTSAADLGDTPEARLTKSRRRDSLEDMSREELTSVLKKSFSTADTETLLLALDVVELEEIKSEEMRHSECGSDHVTLEAVRQPETTYGSPDWLISKGAVEGARQTRKYAQEFANAVEGHTNPSKILSQLTKARRSLDLQPLARSVQRRQTHAIALGALDSNAEAERDIFVAPESDLMKDVPETKSVIASEENVPLAPKFSNTPFAKAIRWFLSKEVLSRAQFDQLDALSQQRAFTVAGLTADQMLSVFQAELTRNIVEGGDLRDFRRAILERAELAGFTPANRSHVETIYRTNVMSTYSAGRLNEMSTPENLKERPLWQIMTVNDGRPRQRKSHQRLHKKILEASDPFWEKAYPPFGYNCRCRVRAIRRKEGVKVVSGSSIRDIPDRGFASGRRGLLSPRF